jgi:DNA polymerase-3 subunit epsilon
MLFDFFRKRKAYPLFWQEYLARFKHSYSSKIPIEEVRFVVVDTETTVLVVKKDKVLSIAAAGVKNRRMEMGDTFNCLVRQELPSGESVKVHGIMTKETQSGLSEAEALEQFLAFCQDSVIVGQHIGFDVAMINAALKIHVGDKLKNKMLDTARLAIRAEHPFDRYYVQVKPNTYSLDALIQRYNIPAQDRHTAAGDAYITAILFLKLLARLQQQGLRTLGDLLGK